MPDDVGIGLLGGVRARHLDDRPCLVDWWLIVSCQPAHECGSRQQPIQAGPQQARLRLQRVEHGVVGRVVDAHECELGVLDRPRHFSSFEGQIDGHLLAPHSLFFLEGGELRHRLVDLRLEVVATLGLSVDSSSDADGHEHQHEHRQTQRALEREDESTGLGMNDDLFRCLESSTLRIFHSSLVGHDYLLTLSKQTTIPAFPDQSFTHPRFICTMTLS